MRGGDTCERGHSKTPENTRTIEGRNSTVCRPCAAHRELKKYWLTRIQTAPTKKKRDHARRISKERGYL